MLRLFISLIALTLSITSLSAREVININRGWQFTPGWEVQKNKYTDINLPHTWNLDALSGKIDYFRGLGNYVKHIEIPSQWKEDKIYIRFKGSNHTTDLYVNGKHVGKHKGGYTAFTWNITPYLKIGEKNTLWVRVDNSMDLDLMPLLGDFNMYGGIYRDVDIIVTPKTHIDLENYSSSGVFITQSNVTDQKADVTITAHIVGEINDVSEVKFTILNQENQIIDSLVRRTKIGNSGKADVEAMFTINQPRLWNSVIDPYMYHADISVKNIPTKTTKTKETEDKITQNFGLRYYSVDKDNQFFLNGKPFKIQGVGKHQDWAGIGNALSPLNHQRDIEIMLEMGVNAVRLTHYPHDPYFLDLCDKAGIIVWSEIPFVGPGGYRDKGFNDSEAFRANGKLQLQEMIRQLYNHPSILFWGLFNELVQLGDDPVPYVRELNELAKEEDPSRITVSASNQDGDLNFITDLVAFNQYFGWYGGMPEDLDRWGAALRKDWPKLMVGVSEYGAGGSIYHQTDSLVKTIPTSYWHPEQWQTHYHEQHWKIISEKPYFWGTFVWVMFDFGAAHRTEGQVPGINDKGLVTFDRATPKDAFYFYKAVWNKKDPFVHIANRRLQSRTSEKQTIKVYSNQESVELIVDGVPQTVIEADGSGIFIWKDIPMSLGEHTVEAISTSGKPDKVRFEIVKPSISLTPKR